jgi:hypothetical protein
MDREIVLAVLVLLIGGLAAEVFGWWPAAESGGRSGRSRERLAWGGIWMPLIPAALVVAALLGWALMEPEDAERLPSQVVLAAIPFLALLARTAARTLRSANRDESGLVAATVGILRPHVVVSPALAATVDSDALQAVREHEEAHARHRDPRRICLAQLATDLQWPWPAAKTRFDAWIHALELARDEEARLRGVNGVDLAAAILAAARLGAPTVAPFAGAAMGSEAALRERIGRLLAPLAPDPVREERSLVALVATAAIVAMAFGAVFGESLMGTLVGTLR